jgi:hypothetical protein
MGQQSRADRDEQAERDPAGNRAGQQSHRADRLGVSAMKVAQYSAALSISSPATTGIRTA